MTPEPTAPTSRRALADLFLISVLILFLELACIRWFPSHVLFLTFFPNTVLLACFLGMSVGCLAAGHRRDYLRLTPLLLLLAVLCGYAIEALLTRWGNYDVGHQLEAPQEVFFGTEFHVQDVAQFPIPMIPNFNFGGPIRWDPVYVHWIHLNELDLLPGSSTATATLSKEVGSRDGVVNRMDETYHLVDTRAGWRIDGWNGHYEPGYGP